MYFLARLHSQGELGGELLRGISKSWIWFDSGMAAESELFSCQATVEPNYNYSNFGTAEAQHLNWALKPWTLKND